VLWLLGADIVTAELASVLVYRQLRTARRRCRVASRHARLSVGRLT